MAARGSRSGDEIRIRMYRVGFGDCFLVTLPGPSHVLVDCGVHPGGDIGTLEQAIADIEAETGGKLAIVIASHAHEDHIAGYLRGAETFKRFTIGEVWLPWSEKKDDPVARALRARLAGLHTALASQFAAAGGSPDVLDILANTSAKRNEPALANLRAGFGTGAKVEYMEAGRTVADAGGVSGLAARLLGPTRSEEFLRKMDPPKAERFPLAVADGVEVMTALPLFEDVAEDDVGPRLTDTQRDSLERAVALSPELLAFALDRYTNNLSVVVVFTYRGKSLLFAGDSQYGGWKSWLEAADAADVLGELCFYKVAHHGSENATPKSALDAMTGPALVAMMSTQKKPWPSIPDKPLLNAIVEQTDSRLFRTDWLPIAGAPEPDDPVPPMPRAGFEVGPFWVDHHITL